MHGLFQADHTSSNFQGLSSTNFTWSILEYLVPYLSKNSLVFLGFLGFLDITWRSLQNVTKISINPLYLVSKSTKIIFWRNKFKTINQQPDQQLDHEKVLYWTFFIFRCHGEHLEKHFTLTNKINPKFKKEKAFLMTPQLSQELKRNSKNIYAVYSFLINQLVLPPYLGAFFSETYLGKLGNLGKYFNKKHIMFSTNLRLIMSIVKLLRLIQ